jgi:protein subunit release factor B
MSAEKAVSKELLFSVTAKDCDWSYTRGTGKGGQKRNKTSSAVHVVHRPSGATGYSEASRSQLDNRKEAFGKMVRTAEFQRWLRLETARLTGELAEMERRVAYELEHNVKIEGVVDGKWKELGRDNR